MNAESIATCLSLFKLDLGITHNLRDSFFSNLIQSTISELEGMGVDLSSSTVEDIQLTVDYSSWMYRKRDQDVGLPRRLQFKIHNRVIQKAGTTDV